MAQLIEILREKIRRQLNHHGIRGGMFSVEMVLIKNEKAFIEDLSAILSRRLADISREIDLVPIVHGVLMKSNAQSKYDLAVRIVAEIEKQA